MNAWWAAVTGMKDWNRSLCAVAAALLLAAAGCGGGEPAPPPADEEVVGEAAVEEGAPAAAPEAAPAPEGGIQEETLPPDAATAAAGDAAADIAARSGSSVSGTALFQQTAGGVRVVVDVSGAEPGEHGVHIHEVGDCSAEDASSAGGHLNPAGVDHGAPDMTTHHPGDLGNIMIGAEGSGRLELTTDALTISDGPAAVVGRAIVVHADRDDMVSQPSGNAGARIGCGVIALK